jgi:hypothetical protein
VFVVYADWTIIMPTLFTVSFIGARHGLAGVVGDGLIEDYAAALLSMPPATWSQANSLSSDETHFVWFLTITLFTLRREFVWREKVTFLSLVSV